MLKVLSTALVATIAFTSVAQAETISGAGATFPAPLYSKWASSYSASGTKLNYQAIGSGGGIKQIQARTVDFGASDKPLTPDQLNASGLYQFPTVVGGVVPIMSIGGLAPGQAHLTGEVLADIYMGRIKFWDDPAIAKLNPKIHMPHFPITVVHRSDGSGTTFLFTSFLSMRDGEWRGKVGASDSVNWPVGLGGKGNDGVAAIVKQTRGAIGYVEYSYAKKTGQNYASVQNKAGQYPQANAASFAAAAGGANWGATHGNYLLLLDQPGAKSWPITGATFILMYKNQANAAKAAAVLKFFDFGYAKGDFAARDLDYVPLPATVKNYIRRQWSQEITAAGKPVYVSPNK